MGGVDYCLLLLLLSLVGRRDQTIESLDKSINRTFIKSVRSYPLERTKYEGTYPLPVAAQVDYLPVSSADSESKSVEESRR